MSFAEKNIESMISDLKDLVSIPSVSNDLHQVGQALDRILKIAEKLGITEQRVCEIQKIAQDPISLDNPVGEEEDSKIGDFVEDESIKSPVENASQVILKEQLMLAIDTLTPREQKVIRLRYGLDDAHPRTLEEVGKEFAVTRERIRQIEAKALRKLRHPNRAKKLEGYCD